MKALFALIVIALSFPSCSRVTVCGVVEKVKGRFVVVEGQVFEILDTTRPQVGQYVTFESTNRRKRVNSRHIKKPKVTLNQATFEDTQRPADKKEKQPKARSKDYLNKIGPSRN